MDSNPAPMIQSHVPYLMDLSPCSSQMEEKWKKCLNLHKVEHG